MDLENFTKKNDKFVSDVETGGFDPNINGLCSIAIKAFNEDKRLNIFIKPNPNLVYNEQALKVNGLSLETLDKLGVTELEAVEKIKTFFRNNLSEKPTIIGQNIQFDVGFIEGMFQRNNCGSFKNMIHYQYIDTLPITKVLMASGRIKIANAKLGTAYTHFTGKEPVDAHDAMGDVLMTEELYNAQLNFLKEQYSS